MSNDAKTYWEGHASNGATVKEMMLDQNAETIDKQDVTEILSVIPDFTGKRVLELGAGIGRFSRKIAESADSVIAVDFIQKFCDKNLEVNHDLANLKVVCSDVTKLDYEPEQFDVIFSNWLMMYLNEDEMVKVLNNILKWLAPGGIFFFRESCYHQSGTRKAEDFNPTIYRVPNTYTSVASCARAMTPKNGNTYGMDIVLLRNVKTYVEMKQNKNQVCWLMQKVVKDTSFADDSMSFQQFLDTKQYSKNGILRYEKVFGLDFLSSGGLESTIKFCTELDKNYNVFFENMKVLDVGTGLGGSAFYMARNFNASVLGIDLSLNMIEIACEKNEKYKYKNVRFEVSDCTLRDFSENSFDFIYSRDTILHIQDKPALFQKFYKWLKPGGKLFISDYCAGEKSAWTDEFTKYVASRGYDLHTPAGYGELIKKAGFSTVVATDSTAYWKELLLNELAKVTKGHKVREEILSKFNEEDLAALEAGWLAKIKRVDEGCQKWGSFYGVK